MSNAMPPDSARLRSTAAGVVAVVVLVALVTIGVVGWRQRGSGDEANATTTSGRAPRSESAVAARRSSRGLALQGAPLPSHTGLRLMVADAPAPFVVDVDSETVRPVTGLPTQGERLVSLYPLGKDALVLSTRICNRCRGSSLGVYLVPRGTTTARRLGTALWASASRDGQAVWMLVRRGGRRCAIREVGLDGRLRRADRRVSCRTGLVADLPAGLLVNSVGPGGSDAHSALLRPDGAVVRFRDWQAQPVVGNLVLSGADRHTPLLLHDMESGVSHRLRWPARPGYGLGEVTGEPNGSRAIVDFAKYSPKHRIDWWLLDTSTRRWQHVPGMPAHLVPKVTDVKWTADGRVVILSRDVVGIWRPGAAHITVGRVRPPKGVPGSNFVIW